MRSVTLCTHGLASLMSVSSLGSESKSNSRINGDWAGPPYEARRADAALHDAVVETRPRSRRSTPRPASFGAVVGAPEHDRIARDAEPVDGIEHATDVEVDFRHRIGNVAGAGLADEVRMRQ